MEPVEDTLMADLLWADPIKDNKCGSANYIENEARGISVMFGKKPLNALLQRENLWSVVRAHQVKKKGYQFHTWNGDEEFPPCVTVFSAPNYCDMKNDAAVMISEGEEVDLKTFQAKKNIPYILPDDANGFAFFSPFMTGHILDIVFNLVKH